MPFIVVPIFGFANAGVSFTGMGLQRSETADAGRGGGLVGGKLIGVLGTAALAIRLGLPSAGRARPGRRSSGVALLAASVSR